jgi:hypothetical protein
MIRTTMPDMPDLSEHEWRWTPWVDDIVSNFVFEGINPDTMETLKMESAVKSQAATIADAQRCSAVVFEVLLHEAGIRYN